MVQSSEVVRAALAVVQGPCHAIWWLRCMICLHYNWIYRRYYIQYIGRQRGIVQCLFVQCVCDFKREVSNKLSHGFSTVGRSMERYRTRSGRIFFGCETIEVNDVYYMK